MDIRILGLWLSASDVEMSFLTHQHWLHPTSISHVWKMFLHRVMLWMGIWVIPCTATLVQVGMDFRMNGVMLSPSDVVRLWLRLRTHTDFIPHPLKCIQRVLATYYAVKWACGSTLTLLRFLCRWGWIFRWLGYGFEPECCKVVNEAINQNKFHPTSK